MPTPLRLVDVSRYQVEIPNPLDLVQAKAAGYHIANVALTGGRGYVSGEWARTYLRTAEQIGMGRACYHWLDGRTTGAQQAAAQLTRMRSLFGSALAGFGHFVDVEEDGKNGITPPTYAHVRDYVDAVQQALGRPISIYSADYWWSPRGWDGASLTPYLMGPPNDPTTDDTASSPGWVAGWGGWTERAVMQWAVRPLPGTGKCSLSVIRYEDVWSVLSGGDMASWILVPCLVSLRNEFNELAPDRDKASDGSIGDTSHAASSSDHNPDETGNTPYEDADSKNEVHAIDVDDDLRKPGTSMQSRVDIITTRHREGRDNRLQNVIYNRRIWSASWGWTDREYTGSNAHTEHAHFSARYTTAQEDDTSPWGLLDDEGVDDDMNAAEMTAWANSPAGRAALAAGVTEAAFPAPAGSTDADGKWLFRTYITNIYGALINTRTYAAEARTAAQQALLKVTQDDTDRQAILDAIAAGEAADAAQQQAVMEAIAALPALVAAGLPTIPGLEPQEVEAYIRQAVEPALANLRVVYAPPAG